MYDGIGHMTPPAGTPLSRHPLPGKVNEWVVRILLECIFTSRNEVVAKVIFLHLFVILFTRRGVCIPACIAGGIPACLAASLQGGVYPSMHCRRYPMPSSRSPGGCIPACIAGGIPACLAAGLQGVYYPSMHCRRYPSMPCSRSGGGVCSIRSMSGRYASYWNAFLLFLFLFIYLLFWIQGLFTRALTMPSKVQHCVMVTVALTSRIGLTLHVNIPSDTIQAKVIKLYVYFHHCRIFQCTQAEVASQW